MGRSTLSLTRSPRLMLTRVLTLTQRTSLTISLIISLIISPRRTQS